MNSLLLDKTDSKQTKTLQYGVYFYGDVTQLKVFPEEKIQDSPDPFWAQGTMGLCSLHEVGLANTDPMGCIVSFLREVWTQVGTIRGQLQT